MTKSSPSQDPLKIQAPPRRRPGMLASLRASFLTGLVVIAPLGLTAYLIWSVVGWIDSFVWPFVPNSYQPTELLNRLLDRTGEDRIEVNVRGVGVIVFLIFTILVGWIAKGLIGRSLLSWAENLVDRMPIVRSIYNGLKQIAETVFAQTETNFDRACLVQYPRPGLWAIAFVSTTAKGEIARKLPRDDGLLSVFLPTTPNPTSGFLLFVPAADVILLDMTVEDAAKLVISAGLVYPGSKEPPAVSAPDAAAARRIVEAEQAAQPAPVQQAPAQPAPIQAPGYPAPSQPSGPQTSAPQTPSQQAPSQQTPPQQTPAEV